MGNLCCAREHSVQFFLQFFYTVKLHSLTWGVWGPLKDKMYSDNPDTEDPSKDPYRVQCLQFHQQNLIVKWKTCLFTK
jgi:hypothetical protein